MKKMKKRWRRALAFALTLLVLPAQLLGAAAQADTVIVTFAETSQNGTLNIPITIKERSGAAAHGYFFRRGIAIEKGLLYSTEDICVVENGKILTSSAEITERHPEDGSISWLLVSAVVDLKPYELKQLRVVNGSAAAAAMTYTQNDSMMAVYSQNIDLVFGYRGIESIKYRGVEQLNGIPVNICVTTGGETYELGVTETTVLRHTNSYSKFRLKGKLRDDIDGEMFVTLAEGGTKFEVEYRVGVRVDNFIMIESIGLTVGAKYNGAKSGKIINADCLDLGNMQLMSYDYTRFCGATGNPENTGYIIGDSFVRFAPIVNIREFKFWDGVSRTAHLTFGFDNDMENWAKLLATPPNVKIDPEQYVKAGQILTSQTGALIDQTIASYKYGYTTTYGSFLVGGIPADTDLRLKKAARVDSMSGESGYNLGFAYMQTGDEELYRIVNEFAETWADVTVYTGQWPQIDGQARARSNLWGALGSTGYFSSHGYYSDESSLYMGYVLSGNEYFYDIFKRGMKTTLDGMYQTDKAGPGPVVYWYWASSDGRHEPPYQSEFSEVRGLIRCKTLYLAYRLFGDERFRTAAYQLVDWAEKYQQPEGFWYNAYFYDGTIWKHIDLATRSIQDYIMLYGFRGVNELLRWEDNETVKKVTLKFADFLCSEGKTYGSVLMHPTGDPAIDGNGDHSRGSSTMTNQLALDVLCTAYEISAEERYLEWLLKFMEYLLCAESGGIGMHIAAQEGYMARPVFPDSTRGTATLKTASHLNMLFMKNREKIKEMGYEHLLLLFGEGARRGEDVQQLDYEYPYVTHSVYEKGDEKTLYVANNYTVTDEWEKDVRLVVKENRLWQDMKNVLQRPGSIMLEQHMKQYDYAVAKQRPISVGAVYGKAEAVITEYSKDRIAVDLSGDFEVELKFETGKFVIEDGGAYDIAAEPIVGGTRIVVTKGGVVIPHDGKLSVKVNSKGMQIETVGAEMLALAGLEHSVLKEPLSKQQLSAAMQKAFGKSPVLDGEVPTWEEFAPEAVNILQESGSAALEEVGIHKKLSVTPKAVSSDEEAVTLAANALRVVYDGPELSANVFLAKESLYDTTVSWESEDESILSADGILDRNCVNRETIKLTATVSKNEARAVREFVIPLKQKGNVVFRTGPTFSEIEHNIIPQRGTFEITFSASPNENNIDSFIAVGSSETNTDSLRGTPFGVRFAVSGCIDAINDTWYYADTVIPYEKGKVYHFRLVIRLGENTYDAYVTPDGGEEVLIGKNYKGRYTIDPPITVADKMWLWSALPDAYRLIDVSLYNYVADPAKEPYLYNEDNLMFGLYDTKGAIALSRFSENGSVMNWLKVGSRNRINEGSVSIYLGDESTLPEPKTVIQMLQKAGLLEETVRGEDCVTPASLIRMMPYAISK